MNNKNLKDLLRKSKIVPPKIGNSYKQSAAELLADAISTLVEQNELLRQQNGAQAESVNTVNQFAQLLARTQKQLTQTIEVVSENNQELAQKLAAVQQDMEEQAREKEQQDESVRGQ